MTRITLDQTTIAQLLSAGGAVRVCDASGQTIGVFQPIGGEPRRPDGDLPFTTEELEKFAREPGGRPLAEILADLEQRA